VRTLNGYDCGLTQPNPDVARWQRDVIPRRAANDLLPALPEANGGHPDVAQVVRVSRISHLPMLRLRGDHDDRTRAFSLARTPLTRFSSPPRRRAAKTSPCETSARKRLFAAHAAKTMLATNSATPTIFSASPGLTLATASTIHVFPSDHLDRWCIARIAPFSSRGVIRSSESTIKPNRATATAAVSQENFASGLIRRPP
jgi:hypothetical protein